MFDIKSEWIAKRVFLSTVTDLKLGLNLLENTPEFSAGTLLI